MIPTEDHPPAPDCAPAPGSAPAPTAEPRTGSGRGGEPAIVAATGAVSGLNYLYTVIMIWLLPPGPYAVLGSVSALLLIWGTVAGASVPWVLAREVAVSGGDAAKRQRAVGFALGATVVQSAAAAIATGLIAVGYADPPTVAASLVAVIVIFAAATATGYLQGQMRFRLFALLRVGEAVVKLFSGVALVVLAGKGSAGAISGFVLGALVVAVVGGVCMTPDLRRPGRALFDRRLWSDTFGLLSIQGGVAVLASLDVVIASLVIGTNRELAVYQAANILGRIPLFIGASVSIVAFPRMAAAVSRRTGEIRNSLWLYLRICVPVTAVAMTAPHPLVRALFPHSYGPVVGVLPWAALAGFSLGLANLSTTYFQAASIIRRPTVTLGAAILVGGVLDYLGLRADGGPGLAGAVAVQSAAVSVSLLRDAGRSWPGCLTGLGRSAAGPVALAVPLALSSSHVAVWLVAAVVFAAVPAADALYRCGKTVAHSPGSRPRVLHLAYEDPRRPGAGGGSVRTHQVNSRLADQFDITVVCAAYRGCRSRLEDGVRYVHVGLPLGYGPSILSYFASIPWALWRHDSDIVVEDFGAPLSSVAVPWLTRRPVVAVVQWLFAAEKWRQYRVPFHLFESVGVRSHRHMIAVSEELGSVLSRRNGHAHVVVVANGLEEEAFVGRCRERRGIGYLGRIEIAQKGLDLLVQAYASVAGSIEQDLFIGGDGPDRDRLATLAAALGVGDRVHFVGRVQQSDRFDWLAGFDFLAMPSRYESFGMVAAEALAVETPVVAFDIPCLRGLVDAGTGVLVPAFDLPGYAQALLRMATDQALARSLGRRGPDKVAGLRWDHLSQVQGGLYESVLQGGPFELPEAPDGAAALV